MTLDKKVITPPKGVLTLDTDSATRKFLGVIRRMMGKRMAGGGE